jgi:hypothetical protein
MINFEFIDVCMLQVEHLLKSLDKKLKEATPDCININPVMLALLNMPQDKSWVKEIIANATGQVEATETSGIKPRDILSAVSFLASYNCDFISGHVQKLTLSLLDKFNDIDAGKRENVFVSSPIRIDVVAGLVGIGMHDEAFTSAYLKFVDEILVSTLNFEGSTIMTIDYLSDILFNFQSMAYVEGTESGHYLTKICHFLRTELSRVSDEKSNIRHTAAALYGLQGLVAVPPLAGETVGPGAAMCAHYVKKLKKMLTTDDTEINIFSCQLNANMTMQHMVLFEYACRRQLEGLGLADDVAFIVSKLKAKMDNRSNHRKLFQKFSSHFSLSTDESTLFVSNVPNGTDQDIEIFHRICYNVCFPALYVVQFRSGDRKGKSVCDPDRESFNVDVSTTPGPPDPHTRYLTQLRDDYLHSRHRAVTVRCCASDDSHRDIVLAALQEATLKLVTAAGCN